MFIIPVRYSSTARDGRASTTLPHQRKGGKKETLHLVQSHGRLVCLWMCERVSLCVCAHLSVCVYELFVSPPQALGCWVCSLKRLCFCCHLSLSLSVSRSLSACLSHSVHLCFVCASVSFAISALSICAPLSALYRNCFSKGHGQKKKKNARRSASSAAFHIQHGE